MSYIAEQLRGIGLIINYKTETPENESGYKVGIQFALNGRTNYISITDSQLTKIYRILSKGEKLHSNRGRGLRRNPIEPTKIARLRKVLVEGYSKVDGRMVDRVTANAIITVYDALSPENKMRYASLPITKMVNIAWKLVR